MRILVLASILLTFSVMASAQCVDTADDPCVSIKQSTVNKSAQVADELIAARDAIVKFKTERAATDAERAAATVLIKGLNDLIATKDLIIAQYEKINELYKKAIDFQQIIIERLEKQLSKPKTGWQKFLTTLKEIALVLAGAALGRGL